LFKAASKSALLNAFLSALQIALGITAQSDGLLADGIHTLSDLAADAIVLFVLYLSARHLSVNARQGGRTDTSIEQGLASLLIAAVLIFTAVEMLWQSIDQSSTLKGGTAMHIGALAVSGFVWSPRKRCFATCAPKAGAPARPF
jgi:divalent metal cation (Fe/Co/Zn/Cd) transporter